MAKVIIYETENFSVTTSSIVFNSRTDGGYVMIRMTNPVPNRTYLSPKLAIEYMRLSMIVGAALKTAMNNRGIPVVTINYQDNGNWAWKKNPVEPKMHMHIIGRAENAIKQIFPEAVNFPDPATGFYDDNEPLNEADIIELKKQIEIEVKKEKYNLKNWLLV